MVERNPKSKIENPKLFRLFRLWGVYTYLQILWVTRDFKQFISYFASDFILNSAGVAAVFLLAERFGGIGAWPKTAVIFMLGYAMVVRGLLEMLFGFNVLWISRRVGRGQLDHTLIQPQPVWVTLLTEGFCPFDGSPAMLAGAGLMAWALRGMSLPVTAGWWGWLALNVLGSAAVVMAYSFLWGSLAFWAPRAAEEVSSSALRAMYQLRVFPLEGVGPLLLGGLLTALPAGFAAWLPCKALLGSEGVGEWGSGTAAPHSLVSSLTHSLLLWTPLAGLVFGVLAAVVFRKGMVRYGRVGSSRYLSFGHRR
jgi:ABC-2 type transport system permease protein